MFLGVRRFDSIFSICRGQALAVAPAGRRKAVPLPRIIEKIRVHHYNIALHRGKTDDDLVVGGCSVRIR